MTLEERLWEDVRNGREVDVERALLIASGVDNEEKITEYKAKIDELDRNFKNYASAKSIQGEIETAKALHEFLWDGMPYTAKGKGLLYTEAIDAQINREPRGRKDCTGLTSLYSVLAARNSLNVIVLANTSHVMPRIISGGRKIDIETTWPLKTAVQMQEKEKWYGLSEKNLFCLVAGIYNNRGAAMIELGRKEEAIKYFDRAIEIEPENATSYINRAIAKKELGMDSEASEDFSKGLELETDDGFRTLLAIERMRRGI